MNITGKVTRGKGSFDYRQIWRHNGLKGQVKRAVTAMQNIYDAETTTDDQRALAAKLEGQLTVLLNMMSDRRDKPKGRHR